MKNKKKTTILLITFFSVILVTGIILAYFLLFKPSKNSNQLFKSSETNRFILAQTAIFNEKYSINYNGIYKFSRINFISFSNLTKEDIKKIYQFYNVEDTMSLIGKFTNTKNKQATENNELLIIQDSSFQFNHNSKPYLSGSIYGNDDLSVLCDIKNNTIYSASLTNLSKSELENLTIKNQINYHGDELFLTDSVKLTIEENNYLFDIIYVYKIQK